MNLILSIVFILNSFQDPSIVGRWKNEKDSKLIWEFTAEGSLIEKYGEAVETTPNTYQLLDRSQRCGDGTTDLADQLYLKITNSELGSFCYYLETLSEEVLVLIDADSGRMLIFNKVAA